MTLKLVRPGVTRDFSCYVLRDIRLEYVIRHTARRGDIVFLRRSRSSYNGISGPTRLYDAVEENATQL